MSARVDIAIVGGQKCGTTTLYRSLARHPELFAPSAKESRAFTLDDDARDAALAVLYAKQGQRRGLHAYAHAWSLDGAIASMAKHNPAMHVVAMTRNPVDRVWSAYNFAVANGWETLPLDEALRAESKRRLGSRIERIELAYAYNSRSDVHLARLHQHFPPSQVHVLPLADLADASGTALAPLLRRLGLSQHRLSPLTAQNEATTPRSPRVQRWVLGESVMKRVVRNALPPRWKSRIHERISAPLLAWNRQHSVRQELTDDARVLITAAVDRS